MTNRDDFDDYKDEAYFEGRGRQDRVFDARRLREPVSLLPTRKPLILSRHESVTDAVRAMKSEKRGVVVVTGDGSTQSPIAGIFTERDVLLRIVDGGRNPATLPLGDVMTSNPECLREDQSIAEALELMSIGGFRHVPVVDGSKRPVFVVSVRDVVQLLVESFAHEVLNRGNDRTLEREGG